VTLERRKRDAYYALRPEYVESLLHLYRATKDDVYRERGWVVFEALRRHCRVESGAFTGLKDVYAAAPRRDDAMPSFFLAETLKYLYLLFSDADLYPADEWTFSTEAHLLRNEPRCARGGCTGPLAPPWWHRVPLDLLVLCVLAGVAARCFRARRPRKARKFTV